MKCFIYDFEDLWHLLISKRIAYKRQQAEEGGDADEDVAEGRENGRHVINRLV